MKLHLVTKKLSLKRHVYTLLIIQIFALLPAIPALSQPGQSTKQVAGPLQLDESTFTSINELIIPVEDGSLLKNTSVDNPDVVSLFNYDRSFAKTILSNDYEKASLNLSLEQVLNVTMDLVEAPDFYYDYLVTTGSEELSKPSTLLSKHFRGVVRGLENESMVSISLFEDQMIGMVSITGHGNYSIGKSLQSDTHRVMLENNSTRNDSFKCFTPDEVNDLYFNQTTTNWSVVGGKCVNLYIETEYDIYEIYGSIVGVEMYVASVMNSVAYLFMQEGFVVKVSEMKIWDVPDPYIADNAPDLLDDFQDQHSSPFNGDLGQLWTFRNMEGNIAGLTEGFTGLCNSNHKFSLSITTGLSQPNEFPEYSFTIHITTHEFGHLLGSRHTNACVWNGDNTPIDTCVGPEDCTGSVPIIPDPPNGGTIMSFCNVRPVGVNFSLGFGPQPGDVIRGSVINASCLEICCNPSTTSLFTLDTSCDEGTVRTLVRASDPTAANQFWGLFETSVEGSTLDIHTIDADPSNSGLDPVQQVNGVFQTEFSWTDLSKHYYIKHGIWQDDCYTWRETRLPVPEFEVEPIAFHFEDAFGLEKEFFCVGEDVFLNGEDSDNYTRYLISLWKRAPLSGNDFTWVGTLDWVIDQEIGIVNLSEEFGNLNPPIDFQAGYEYQVRLALSNFDECVGWTALTHTLTVTCCNEFSGEEECADSTPGNLQSTGATLTWDPVPGAVGYIIDSPGPEEPQISCFCDEPVPLPIIEVEENHYTLSEPYVNQCHIWRVRAFCCNAEISMVSQQACYYGAQKSMTKMQIAPNPNNGRMIFKVDGEKNMALQIDIYRYDGLHIDRKIGQTNAQGKLMIEWDGRPFASQGLYMTTVRFSNGEKVSGTFLIK